MRDSVSVGHETRGKSADCEADRRSQPRRRVLKSGIIAFNARQSSIPCVVRNLSKGGARLKVSGSINAPDTFELFIELDGSWVTCEVISRSGDDMSVRFTSAMEKRKPARKQVVQVIAPKEKVSLRRKPVQGL